MRGKWLVGFLVLSAWLWIFRGPLFRGEVCALRDAGNFYYPLFSWECGEWSAGRIPLWNPHDGLGTPTLADGSSSVLYPGKLVFALPISFELRFTLYIASHILFAAWSVYFVARRWGSSEFGGGIAALSYAFGGYVLFQHCNPIFLISAAWLPLAVWLTDHMLVRRSARHAVMLGMVLAVMTLGGDPQTACHAGILAAVYALVLWWRRRTQTGSADPPVELQQQNGFHNRRPVLLGLAAVSAFGLAAIQILPTWEWTRQSDRAQFDKPRSLYEVAQIALTKDTAGALQESRPLIATLRSLISPSAPGTHAADLYDYSLGPWRLIELIAPNISGRMYPMHHRWLSSLPAEGKAWTPTLYFGLFPFFALIMAWRLRGMTARESWLKWLVVLGLFGSLGWYGLGWLIHEIRASMADSPSGPAQVWQPVGGLYWWLVTVLPGYAYFRYPAKWFVVTTLGCSLLAARGTDRLLNGEIRALRPARFCFVGGILTLLASVLGRRWLLDRLNGANPSDLFGPLHPEGAWRDIFFGVLVFVMGSGLLWYVIRSQLWSSKTRLAAGLLVLTAVDLVLANEWLVETVPASVFSRPAPIADRIVRGTSLTPGSAPPRIIHTARAFKTPTRWREQSDPDRLAEIVTWERDSLLHRHHLSFGVVSLVAPTTIRSAWWMQYLRTSRARALANANRASGDFAWLGLDYWIDCSPRADRGLPTFSPASPSWPHVWLAPPDHSLQQNQAAGSCELIRYEPQYVEVRATLKQAATLVLNDAYDRNWVASGIEIETGSERPLEQTAFHRIARGIDLPAGEHHIVFRYRSRPLYWGAAITCATLAFVCTGLLKSRNH